MQEIDPYVYQELQEDVHMQMMWSIKFRNALEET